MWRGCTSMVMTSPRPKRIGGGDCADAIDSAIGQIASDSTKVLIIATSPSARRSGAQMPGDQRSDLVGHGDGQIMVPARQHVQSRIAQAKLQMLAHGDR